MKFILTIDTEGDNQWDHGRDLTVENIKFVPRFQELCRKYGINPVYLVTSEICNDAFSRELFTDYIKNYCKIYEWEYIPMPQLRPRGFRIQPPN